MQQDMRFLEVSKLVVDRGELIGKNPDTITQEIWAQTNPPVGYKAIRAKCMDCSSQDFMGIRKCVCTDCPLWPLRMGHTPKELRKMRKSTAKETT